MLSTVALFFYFSLPQPTFNNHVIQRHSSLLLQAHRVVLTQSNISIVVVNVQPIVGASTVVVCSRYAQQLLCCS
jgi:hypothetical protein